MSLVLDLPPETRLREAAAWVGADAGVIPRTLLEEGLWESAGQPAPLNTTASTEELNQAPDALAQRNQGRPLLPPEAF